jgi:dienelactone hydrolase
MRILVAAAVGTVLLAGCGSSARHAAPAPARLAFADPPGAPPAVLGSVASRSGRVVVRNVYFSSGSDVVSGYLVARPGRGRRYGVVLVHGSGGDRSELLPYAVDLARRGAVALTLTEPSETRHPPAPTTIRQLLAQSRAAQVADVVAVRRAADVLAAEPGVARGRVGYLGWSAGAKTGTFVAAADRRFQALALLSAGADPVSAFVAAAPAPARPLVRRQLGLIDPIRYVAFAQPHTLLLVDGRRDAVVPHRALLNIVHAAPSGTTVRWVDAGHALTPAAFRAAGAWVLARLRSP